MHPHLLYAIKRIKHEEVLDMKKPKTSEKILLDEIFGLARSLASTQRGMHIGHLLSLIRNQLGISQSLLAAKAKVPQSTISRIESGKLIPNISTLDKIFNSITCDILITIVPRENLDNIRKTQARKKANKKIEYIQATMALEKQEPDSKLLQELINEEEKKLLNSSSYELWED